MFLATRDIYVCKKHISLLVSKNKAMRSNDGVADWTGGMKKFAFVVGGVISITAGGYLIYRKISRHKELEAKPKFIPSPDLPSDPEHPPIDPSKPTSVIPDNTTATKSTQGEKSQTLNEKDILLRVQRIKEEGNKLYRDNVFEKALDRYNNALALCPPECKLELAALHQNKAAVYDKLGELEKSFDECTKALQYNNRYIKALFRRGNICEKQENWAQASHDFLKCSIIENFMHDETTRKADYAMRMLSRSMAKDYLKERRQEKKPRLLSQTVVRSTLKSFGYDPVLSDLNRALFGDYKHQESKQSSSGDSPAGVIISANEENERRSNYARIMDLMTEQRFDDVVEVCTKEIESEPTNENRSFVECLLIRAFFYNLTGYMDRARKDLSAASEFLKSENAIKAIEDERRNKLECSVLMLDGFCDHLMGDIDSAMQKLSQALQLCPQNSDVYNLRGQVKGQLFETGVEEAIADFAKAAELKPDFLPYKLQLLAVETKYAAERGNRSEVTRLFEQIKHLVNKHENDVDANLFFAQVMMEMEQPSEAEIYIKKALRLNSSCPEAYAQLALIDMMQGREDQGLRSINKALEIDSHCLLVLEILAQYHTRRSDVPKLMECYDKVLQVARSEVEVAHFINMREAALINIKVAEELMLN